MEGLEEKRKKWSEALEGWRSPSSGLHVPWQEGFWVWVPASLVRGVLSHALSVQILRSVCHPGYSLLVPRYCVSVPILSISLGILGETCERGVSEWLPRRKRVPRPQRAPSLNARLLSRSRRPTPLSGGKTRADHFLFPPNLSQWQQTTHTTPGGRRREELCHVDGVSPFWLSWQRRRPRQDAERAGERYSS